MKLRHDFVETICRLYIEKHKPLIFKKVQEKERIHLKDGALPSLDSGLFTKIALNDGKRTFSELINKQEGFLALQSYFLKASLLLDREKESMDNSHLINQ